MGPLRFTYNQQTQRAQTTAIDSQNNLISEESKNIPVKKYLVDINLYDSTGSKTYILKTTSNNLRYVEAITDTPKSFPKTSFFDINYLKEILGYDTTFNHDFINTFCDFSNILIQLSNFHPIVRVCLVMGLKYIKPLFYQLTYHENNNRNQKQTTLVL